jgi:hypothetical protein
MLMLNKYYALTDDSIVYRIAMSMSNDCLVLDLLILHSVLHPHHKTTYFSKAGWPHDWIKTAKEIVRKEWEEKYKPMGTSMMVASGTSTPSNTVCCLSFIG